MKTALVLRHLAFEDAGLFADPLRKRGYTLRELDAGVDATPTELEAADLLVVCGGPIGVYETDRYPCLLDEIDALRSRLQARRPTLGLCLGAQLMAAALGARVYPGGRKELGWAPLQLSAAGQASPLGVLGGQPVLHWHGDTFDLPAGATLLASTALYPHQAFSHGPHALALQFHVEADWRRIEQWLIGHAGELAAAGIDVNALRAASQLHGPALQTLASELIGRWLDSQAD
jgi:GMP synthase (glutamine-hydrolysing)